MQKPAPAKSLENYFIDWESQVFGYGYGSGEEFYLAALKGFLDCCGLPGATSSGSYDYRDLEALMGPTSAWLLINVLCKAQVIEYGTSPRFGWLTPEGERLKQFCSSKSVEQLCELVCNVEPGEPVICYPDSCNCGPNGYDSNLICQNPFWPHQ